MYRQNFIKIRSAVEFLQAYAGKQPDNAKLIAAFLMPSFKLA
jgi:hypothetical protein